MAAPAGNLHGRTHDRRRRPQKAAPGGPHAQFPSSSQSLRGAPDAPSNSSVRLVASLALVVVAGVWGSSYLVVKDLLAVFPPSRYLALRYLIALPFVAVYFRAPLSEWYRTTWSRSGPRGRLPYLLPGLCLVLAMATQAYGIRSASPGVAAFLSSLVFCFIPLFEIASGEWTRLRYLVGPLVLALAGTVLTTGVAHAAFSLSDGLLILCAAGYAGQIFFTGRLVRASHFAVPFVTQGIVVFSAAVAGTLFLDGGAGVPVRSMDVVRLCYVALVATVFCYLVQNWAQRYLRSRYVGFIYALEPMAALLMSILLGYEAAQTAVIVGCTAILAAALLSLWLSTVDTPEQRGHQQETV